MRSGGSPVPGCSTVTSGRPATSPRRRPPRPARRAPDRPVRRPGRPRGAQAPTAAAAPRTGAAHHRARRPARPARPPPPPHPPPPRPEPAPRTPSAPPPQAPSQVPPRAPPHPVARSRAARPRRAASAAPPPTAPEAAAPASKGDSSSWHRGSAPPHRPPRPTREPVDNPAPVDKPVPRGPRRPVQRARNPLSRRSRGPSRTLHTRPGVSRVDFARPATGGIPAQPPHPCECRSVPPSPERSAAQARSARHVGASGVAVTRPARTTEQTR